MSGTESDISSDPNTDSSSESGISDSEGSYEGSVHGIQPYAYEPEYSDQEEEEEFNQLEEVGFEAELEPGREADEDVSWCECGNCRQMTDGLECCCCQEMDKIKCKIAEAPVEGLQCITTHPGFQAVCLDVWVLQTAYFAYRQQYGHLNVPIHKQYRYTAYRQLVRWCWGYLGRHHRVVLPSCAVSLIRETFPSPEYVGFAYPVLID